jgi:hypothetical protein
MAKKKTKRKSLAPKHSAPIEMTEQEVRAARQGKGIHKLPGEESRQRDYAPVEPANSVRPKS